MPVVATGSPFRSQASSRCASTVGCPDSRSIQGELSMRTMPLAEEHGAGRAEAHLATERPERAVGLVLIDEGLEGCVDDLDLAPHTRQPPGARDEIVPEIDHRACHDIQLPDRDIAVNAPRARGMSPICRRCERPGGL